MRKHIQTHRPPHVFQENALYFITGRTYAGLPHLFSNERKEKFRKILFEKAVLFTRGRSLKGRNLKVATPKAATPPCSGVATFTSRFDEVGLHAWIILDNHYHLLIKLLDGTKLPQFTNHLHGASAYTIKKLPSAVLHKEQIAHRTLTPLEKRQDRRLEKLVDAFQDKFPEERSLKAATPNVATPKAATPQRMGIATFRSRFTFHLNKQQLKSLGNALQANDRLLAKVLLASFLPQEFDIPFWYQYLDRIIRNEKDYYMHLNYIHQNVVKHKYTAKINNYEFSSIHRWIKEKGRQWVVDCFRNYPIVDFQPEEIVE